MGVPPTQQAPPDHHDYHELLNTRVAIPCPDVAFVFLGQGEPGARREVARNRYQEKECYRSPGQGIKPGIG